MGNFQTVGLIAPRSEQREPKEKKKDIWDRLKDGLDIANGVLGIGVNYKTYQKYSNDIAAQEDTRAGNLTKAEELDYAAKGLTPAQKDAQGNYPAGAIPYKSRQGENLVDSALMREAKPEKPIMGWITQRNADGSVDKSYGPLTQGLKVTDAPPQAKPDKPREGWIDRRGPDGKMTRTWGPLTAGTTSEVEPMPKPEGADLPVDKKAEVTALAGKNSSKLAIRNQIAGYKEQFDAAKTEDEKIRIGRQMIKVLNSSEGSDAVGAEEVKRLGEALEYQLFNITGPGKTFGRDLEGFDAQVESTLGALDSGLSANQARMDELMGRSSGKTSEYKPGQLIQVKSTGKMYRVGEDGHSLEEVGTP